MTPPPGPVSLASSLVSFSWTRSGRSAGDLERSRLTDRVLTTISASHSTDPLRTSFEILSIMIGKSIWYQRITPIAAPPRSLSGNRSGRLR